VTTRSGRGSVISWVVGCLVLVTVVASTGLGGSAPALGFRQAGHWVYNHTLGAVFHVNGGSKSVDAKVGVPGIGPANQVVQSDRQGYVVDSANGRVVVFGKATLKVDSTVSVGTNEEPVGLEVTGGPYLIYQHGGMIVRLGQPPVTVAAGGPLGRPITTTDGTVWVERSDSGALCRLARTASQLTCPAHVPQGHQGALTALDDRPAFVDTSADTAQEITADGLGKPVPLGVNLPPNAQVAGSDAGGRLPIVNPGSGPSGSSIVLVDTSTIGTGKPAARPIQAPLGAGSFSAPVTSGGAVVIVDKTAHRILTLTNQGARKASMMLPAGAGDVRLARGEDGRVYADSADGTHVLVIDGDGSMTPVNVGGSGAAGPPTGTPSQPKPPGTSRPRSPHPTTPPGAPNPAPPAPPTGPLPGAPRAVDVTPSDGGASVSWTPPATRSSHLTGYVVSWRAIIPAGPTIGSVTVSPDTLQSTVAGLANGTTYVVTVNAQNQAGVGPGTDSAPFSPVPQAPVGVRALAHPDGSVTVTWGAPAQSNGMRYVLVAAQADGASQTVTRTDGTRVVVTGLTLGARYTFTVTAIDSHGQTRSAASNSVIPFLAPGAPGHLVATRGAGQVGLSWTAPPAGGGQIVGYLVTATGAPNRLIPRTYATVTNLHNGTTYRFTVRAVIKDPNGTGTTVNGVPAAVSASPATVPTVAIVSAVWTGSGQAVVQVNVDDGGAAPVNCTVILNGILPLHMGACDSNHPLVLTGLNDTTDYQLQVSGTNAIGAGPTSATYPLGPHSSDSLYLHVSKGAPHKTAQCTASTCAGVHVTMAGAAPGGVYTFTCFSTSAPNGFGQFNAQPDSYGYVDAPAGCTYGKTGEQVWVTADNGFITSPRVQW
jgi:hypothetical protein